MLGSFIVDSFASIRATHGLNESTSESLCLLPASIRPAVSPNLRATDRPSSIGNVKEKPTPIESLTAQLTRTSALTSGKMSINLCHCAPSEVLNGKGRKSAVQPIKRVIAHDDYH